MEGWRGFRDTNPGKFNCYAKLADDEPYFVLSGKDPVAPYLVLAWREIRSGNVDAAKSFMDIAMKNPHSDPTWLTDERIREIKHGDDAMPSEILALAGEVRVLRLAMKAETWRKGIVAIEAEVCIHRPQ